MRSEVVFYAFKRLAIFPIYFLVFSFLIFSVVMSPPGDPVDIIAGPTASEETRQLISKEYGFDRPVYEQYISYMGDFMRLDFGNSLRFSDRSVGELLWERVQVSAPLGLVASVIGVFLGILVGLFATFKRGTWLDTVLLSGFLVFAAIPSLLLIQFFILLFSLKLGWLPAGWQGGWAWRVSYAPLPSASWTNSTYVRQRPRAYIPQRLQLVMCCATRGFLL